MKLKLSSDVLFSQYLLASILFSIFLIIDVKAQDEVIEEEIISSLQHSDYLLPNQDEIQDEINVPTKIPEDLPFKPNPSHTEYYKNVLKLAERMCNIPLLNQAHSALSQLNGYKTSKIIHIPVKRTVLFKRDSSKTKRKIETEAARILGKLAINKTEP